MRPEALLAEALGWSGTDAPARARALLEALGGLPGLLAAGEHELVVAGVPPGSAKRFCATLALVMARLDDPSPMIRTAQDVVALVGAELRLAAEERLVLLCLSRRHRLLCLHTVTIGSHSLTIVDPAQIYGLALRHRAASIVIAHNHPSGDPTPSVQDVDVTRRVVAAGGVLGVALLDHLIIGTDGYVSLRERGDVPGAILAQVSWAP